MRKDFQIQNGKGFSFPRFLFVFEKAFVLFESFKVDEF